jgi:hypothetical protein
MTKPINNQIPNPIQFDTPNSAIIYKQQINPSRGINERLLLNAQIHKKKVMMINIHIGILCLNKLNPDSNFTSSFNGNELTKAE